MRVGPPRRVYVPLRWRDLDHQGHVYHATMLTLLDEARTVWLHEEIGVASPDQYVIARIEIDYLAETTMDSGGLEVEFGVERVGRTSITSAEIVRAKSGGVVARALVTSVMWDRSAGRPRPLAEHERTGASRAQLATVTGVDGHA